MRHLTLALALASSATALSFQSKRQETGYQEADPTEVYLTEICLPGLQAGNPDYSAPCNTIRYIVGQCGFGPAFDSSQSNDTYGLPEDAEEQNFTAQRDCACQSQFFNVINGCLDCYTKHGGADDGSVSGVKRDDVASASSSYCAVTNTPTADLAEFLFYLGPTDSESTTTTATSSFSDPIGNQTAVSLYYTPSVTGTGGYVPAQPTLANGTVSFTSLNSVSGQIVPTGQAAQSGGSGSGSQSGSGSAGSSASDAASSTTTDSGAMETAALKLGGVGMLGFAAAVAML